MQQQTNKLSDLGLGHLGVHRVLRFEDLLNLLLRSKEEGHRQQQVRGQTARKCYDRMLAAGEEGHLRSELLPSLEKVLGRHFSGLEKLVEHHWKFHSNVLESAAVSVHTRTKHTELARERILLLLLMCRY